MGGRGFSIVIGTTVGTVKTSKSMPRTAPGPQMLAKNKPIHPRDEDGPRKIRRTGPASCFCKQETKERMMERKERMLEDGKSRSRSQLKGEEEGWEWRSEDQGWKEDQPSCQGRSGSRAESPQPQHLQPQDDNLLAEQILKTFFIFNTTNA